MAKRKFADGRETSDRIVNVRVPHSLYSQFELLAVEREQSISSLAREAMVQFILDEETKRLMSGEIPRSIGAREVRKPVIQFSVESDSDSVFNEEAYKAYFDPALLDTSPF